MLEKESNVRMADKTLRKVIWCNLVNIRCYPVSIPIYLKEFNTHQINQRLSEEISPGYSLEGLMLKLKLQYFGKLRRRAASFEKTLMLGKIEGRRKRGQQRMRWLDGITDSMDPSHEGLRPAHDYMQHGAGSGAHHWGQGPPGQNHWGSARQPFTRT